MRFNLRLLTWTVLVISCTTKPKSAGETKSSSSKELDDAQVAKLTEMKEETEVGRNMAGRLLQFYGTVDDEGLNNYLNQVGQFVASYGDFPERRYMFAILNQDQVNAFACPGGYILVTAGALRNARNEAELAHILGHEIAHVGHRHMYNTLKSMTPEDLAKVAKEAEKSRQDPSLNPRKRPDPNTQSEAGKVLARYLSGAQGGLSILQAAKAGMSVILEKGLGADLEYAADKEGVKYAIRAGYHPPALNDFLCRIDHGMPGNLDRCQNLPTQKKDAPKTVLEKTHPPIDERVKNIQLTLKDLDSESIIGALGKARFDKFAGALPTPKSKTR